MTEFLFHLFLFVLQLLGWHFYFELSWLVSVLIAVVVQFILFLMFRAGAGGAALDGLGDIFD
jgi:hypothetical protein